MFVAVLFKGFFWWGGGGGWVLVQSHVHSSGSNGLKGGDGGLGQH